MKNEKILLLLFTIGIWVLAGSIFFFSNKKSNADAGSSSGIIAISTTDGNSALWVINPELKVILFYKGRSSSGKNRKVIELLGVRRYTLDEQIQAYNTYPTLEMLKKRIKRMEGGIE